MVRRRRARLLCRRAAAGRARIRHLLAAARRNRQRILDGYTAGTRFSIQADTDGLLRAGVPGVQLTWMDAKVGDWVVTPRIGKPVEVQALWINALRIAARWSDRWRTLEQRARSAFATRFPDPATGGLSDVVDADHVAGALDRRIRPNQIFAAGGLPFPIVTDEQPRAASSIRSSGSCSRRSACARWRRTIRPMWAATRGGRCERDGAYHQGTVWPWLLGPFVEAWLRVQRRQRGRAKAEARERFLGPLFEHLDTAGSRTISPKIADGDAPHTPGGTPFQAWSLGELMRVECCMHRCQRETR